MAGGGIYRKTWLHSAPPVHLETDGIFAHGHVTTGDGGSDGADDHAIVHRAQPTLGATAASAEVIASAEVVTTESTGPVAPQVSGAVPGEHTMTSEEARRRLHEIYTLHLPSKLHAIPGLLQTYAGREAEIVHKVEAKYTAAPTSAAGLMKQNKRMKAARALVQQKAVIAKSWPLWYDDMRATIPPKLWPLAGELPSSIPDSELPTNYRLRLEPGGGLNGQRRAGQAGSTQNPHGLRQNGSATCPSTFCRRVW